MHSGSGFRNALHVLNRDIEPVLLQINHILEAMSFQAWIDSPLHTKLHTQQ